MLPIQFFGQNVHFVISLLAALVFFAVFWLYFDAWLLRRRKIEIFEWAGFLLLALGFVLYATDIEQSVLGHSLLGNYSETMSRVLRLVAYVVIVIGQVLDPLQEKPELKGISEDEFSLPLDKHTAISGKVPSGKSMAAAGASSLANPLHFLPAFGALGVALVYWRRATTGLERHLKPIAVAFLLLFGFEVLSLARLWQGTTNPQLARLVVSFGPLWIAAHALLLMGVIILGRWVWQYLTRRFMSQLFMIFTTVTLAVFLLTTMSFTFLLVNSVQAASLNNLATAANVLNYAISNKKADTLANTEAIAENPNIASAIIAGDHNQLASLTNTFLRQKKQSSLVITSNTGEVLLRAEDPGNYGDSLSSDTLIQRALVGEPSSSISSKSGVLAPVITIRSATPIRDANHEIIGATVGGVVIDNAFVDGIKQATGLDSSVYAGNVLSATTFVAPDGVTRTVGVNNTNNLVKETVVQKAHTFKGAVRVLNRQYLAVYVPLKDVDNSVVGMLFVGQPQVTVLQTAGHSIELTFVVTAILLLLSVLPAYIVARYLARQLD